MKSVGGQRGVVVGNLVCQYLFIHLQSDLYLHLISEGPPMKLKMIYQTNVDAIPEDRLNLKHLSWVQVYK